MPMAEAALKPATRMRASGPAGNGRLRVGRACAVVIPVTFARIFHTTHRDTHRDLERAIQHPPEEHPHARDNVSSVNDLIGDSGTGTRAGSGTGHQADRVDGRPVEARAGAGGAADRTAACLVTAISLTRQALRRAVRRSWHEQPLPSAQSELLRLAAAQPGISVAAAARELRLAPNTISTLVGRLVAAGLLERGRRAADGRAVFMTITDRARDRIADWRDLRVELAGRALTRLGESDQKALSRAIPALQRLVEQLEEDGL